jgi:translation initiation factor RLI1
MPNPRAIVNYRRCDPNKCDTGICAAVLECPNKVLKQEAPYEVPFSHPSRFCKGCAKCVQACPFEAIHIALTEY